MVDRRGICSRRVFVSSLPGLALGLAALTEWAVGLGSALLVCWNGLFLLQYRLGYIPMNRPPTLWQFTLGKLWMPADLGRRLLARGGLIP